MHNTSFAKRWPSYIGAWTLVLLIALPFLVIAGGLLFSSNTGENISSLVKWDWLPNTLMLVFLVAFLSAVLGAIPAFIITQYTFPLRSFFRVTLILPLAIPGYIMAVIYSGIFDYGGEWQHLQALINGGAWQHQPVWHIRSFTGLTIILALASFPYVFIAAHSAFASQSARLQESAYSLGASRFTTLRKIIFPVALPGILAGCGLVMMETLNEYGACAYYGVSTVTTEIFRYWNADIIYALYFSGWILIFLFLILYLRSYFSANRSSAARNQYTQTQKKLTGLKATGAIIACGIPLLFGFIIPVFLLVKWAFQRLDLFKENDFLAMIVNSFQLAAIAGIITVLLSVLLTHLFAMNHRLRAPVLSRAGYIMPAAILAIGVLGISTAADAYLDLKFPNVLTGSITVLITAYVARFLSVSLDPLQAVYRSKGMMLNETAQSLGARPWRIFTRISIPVFEPVLLATFLLVFIDVLKELPLTLILRPFNFETLSTSVFQYAKVNESVAQAAPAALIIVLLGMLAVIILHRFITHAKNA